MGYNIKLYFGENDNFKNKNGSRFTTVGMVDLVKIGEGKLARLDSYRNKEKFPPTSNSVKFITNQKKDNRYIKSYISLDGNLDSTEDDYGNRLYSYPAQEILAALREDNSKESYRRFEIAIVTLETFIKVLMTPEYCFGDVK